MQIIDTEKNALKLFAQNEGKASAKVYSLRVNFIFVC